MLTLKTNSPAVDLNWLAGFIEWRMEKFLWWPWRKGDEHPTGDWSTPC